MPELLLHPVVCETEDFIPLMVFMKLHFYYAFCRLRISLSVRKNESGYILSWCRMEGREMNRKNYSLFGVCPVRQSGTYPHEHARNVKKFSRSWNIRCYSKIS